ALDGEAADGQVGRGLHALTAGGEGRRVGGVAQDAADGGGADVVRDTDGAVVGEGARGVVRAGDQGPADPPRSDPLVLEVARLVQAGGAASAAAGQVAGDLDRPHRSNREDPAAGVAPAALDVAADGHARQRRVAGNRAGVVAAAAGQVAGNLDR